MPPTAVPPRLARLFLAVASLATAIAVVATIAWYRADHRRPRLDDLTSTERQTLIEQALEASPGIYEPAWYEPRIAFTLRPNSSLEAWDDTFTSNELGYRTGGLRKPRGTYRILFVGDSWTYGMGVRLEESFPKVLEALANEHGGAGRPIEAWTLALPGYQTSNEVAALQLFFGLIAPDAVVLVPSSNDNQSSTRVLPNGSLHLGAAALADPLGRPHDTWYRLPAFCNSWEYLERWRLAFAQLRKTEVWLEARGVPVFFFYVATWDPAVVHWLVQSTGLDSPYAVVPAGLTHGEWLTPAPTHHGNAAANERYAQLLYRLLAGRLGWQPLASVHAEIASSEVFERPPADADWRSLSRELIDRWSRQGVPEEFRRGDPASTQWAGPGDPATGDIGPSTTVLVRPPARSSALEIQLEPIAGARGYYPVEVEVSVPSPGGGTSARATVDRGNPTSLRLPLPKDLEPGAAVDVIIVPARAALRPATRIVRSVRLVSILPIS